MAGQVDEGYNLGAFLADLHPVQRAMFGFVYDVTAAVEAEDVVPDGTSTARFHFVLVPEQFLPLTKVIQ